MKLLAVVKREYTQRVRAKMFIVTTVLLPVAIALFGLAPAIDGWLSVGTHLASQQAVGSDVLRSALRVGDRGHRHRPS